MKKRIACVAALTLAATIMAACGERGSKSGTASSAFAPVDHIALTTSPIASDKVAPTTPQTLNVTTDSKHNAPAALAPQVGAAPAKTSAVVKAAPQASELRVKRLVVAHGIKDCEPVEVTSEFSLKDLASHSDAKVFAFVEVENHEHASGAITVTFEPPTDAKGMRPSDIKLDVGASPRFRTWAFTRTANTAGTWHAVVKNGRGEVLARTPFEITS